MPKVRTNILTFSRILAISLAIALAAHANPVDLDINVVPRRASYRTGDKLTIQMRYQNTSVMPIRLLPNLLVYPAAAFKFQNTSNGKLGTLLKYSEIGIDVEQWAKDIVTLKPGQTCVRDLRVEVADKLPAEYGKHARGLYVIFPVSAIALPEAGAYSISMSYDSIEHPVRRVVEGYPEFWQGKTASPTILAHFQER